MFHEPSPVATPLPPPSTKKCILEKKITRSQSSMQPALRHAQPFSERCDAFAKLSWNSTKWMLYHVVTAILRFWRFRTIQHSNTYGPFSTNLIRCTLTATTHIRFSQSGEIQFNYAHCNHIIGSGNEIRIWHKFTGMIKNKLTLIEIYQNCLCWIYVLFCGNLVMERFAGIYVFTFYSWINGFEYASIYWKNNLLKA